MPTSSPRSIFAEERDGLEHQRHDDEQADDDETAARHEQDRPDRPLIAPPARGSRAAPAPDGWLVLAAVIARLDLRSAMARLRDRTPERRTGRASELARPVRGGGESWLRGRPGVLRLLQLVGLRAM